jgi:hypothetical protein
LENTHWLRLQHLSLTPARRATASEARLIHLDLAARYSVMAAAESAEAAAAAAPLPFRQLETDEPAYYERLEIGARWLASRTGKPAEQQEHLAQANRYARLRLENAQWASGA